MVHKKMITLIQFQSTLPRRERLYTFVVLAILSKISIHAPAKGATELSKAIFVPSTISIHAPAKGATWMINGSGLSRTFQSTLPRRERLCCFSTLKNPYLDFNPRSREGSDISQSVCTLITSISIHAPAKGATDVF